MKVSEVKNMPKIVLENITKRWNKFYAVENLNLVIEDNAFVTLLGPSGCGKTTTLRMIAGLETPTEGRITIGDKVVFDSEAGINVPANKRKVGFLFQNYALWPNMTVYDNMAFSLKLRGVSEEEKEKKVRAAAKILDIEHLLDRKPTVVGENEVLVPRKNLPGLFDGGRLGRLELLSKYCHYASS